MQRGEVWDVDLGPVSYPRGSEQAGIRPAIIVSGRRVNITGSVLLVVPCTRFRPRKPVYPHRVLLRAPEGGLRDDSIALGDQLRAVDRIYFRARRGQLSAASMSAIEEALVIALGLDETA